MSRSGGIRGAAESVGSRYSLDKLNTRQAHARYSLPAIIGVVVVLTAAMGCGGGGESSTPTIAKTAFVKQARAICKGTGEKVNTEGFAVLQEVEKSSGKS